jgi:hypothetical protein
MGSHGVVASGCSERESDWGSEMVVIRRSRKKAKTFAAVVGGGAMVALGAVGALTGGGGSAAPVTLSVGEMTMGATATADYTETSVQTSVALPADKATPPCGFASSC